MFFGLKHTLLRGSEEKDRENTLSRFTFQTKQNKKLQSNHKQQREVCKFKAIHPVSVFVFAVCLSLDLSLTFGAFIDPWLWWWSWHLSMEFWFLTLLSSGPSSLYPTTSPDPAFRTPACLASLAHSVSAVFLDLLGLKRVLSMWGWLGQERGKEVEDQSLVLLVLSLLLK